MKKIQVTLIIVLFSISSFSQSKQRTDLNLPKFDGYNVIAGDFHMHTIFTDGNVWPTVRVDEAWKEGLDVISITDHIEYQPHKEYIPINHNAPYLIAKEYASQHDIIIIQGCEITRDMPPGHLNAIFISDASKIETERVKNIRESGIMPTEKDTFDYKLAIEEAYNQNAFIFWNHPGWTAQASEKIKLWDEHKELIEKGWMHGIEVACWNTWYPEALAWALEYDLTILGSSDVHEPIDAYLQNTYLKTRPMTLLLVKEKNNKGVREALDQRRTMVWFDNLLIGKEEFLEPFFKNAISIGPAFYKNDKGVEFITIKNTTGIEFTFFINESEDMIKLKPFRSIIWKVNKDDAKTLHFNVTNLITKPDSNLITEIKLK